MAEPILDANAAQTYAQPTDSGYFGQFGGRFVAETLTHALDSLAALYAEMKNDPDFKKELHEDLAHFVCILYTSDAADDMARGWVGGGGGVG